jgi:hypothetical protein
MPAVPVETPLHATYYVAVTCFQGAPRSGSNGEQLIVACYSQDYGLCFATFYPIGQGAHLSSASQPVLLVIDED